jgi:putative endonuclease
MYTANRRNYANCISCSKGKSVFLAKHRLILASFKYRTNRVIMAATRQSKRELGTLGELIAAQALEAHGYTVIERNWRWMGGEADLIALHDGCHVIVEVKLRSSDAFGSPEEGVTAKKRNRLLQTGLMYMSNLELLDQCWRIDVVAIVMTGNGKVRRLAIYQDAIRADE